MPLFQKFRSRVNSLLTFNPLKFIQYIAAANLPIPLRTLLGRRWSVLYAFVNLTVFGDPIRQSFGGRHLSISFFHKQPVLSSLTCTGAQRYN